MLTNVDIQAAIQDAIKERSQRTQVSQDDVGKELARIAFSDMRAYVDWGPDGVHLKASHEFPEGTNRAVAEVSS